MAQMNWYVYTTNDMMREMTKIGPKAISIEQHEGRWKAWFVALCGDEQYTINIVADEPGEAIEYLFGRVRDLVTYVQPKIEPEEKVIEPPPEPRIPGDDLPF